MTSPLDVTKVPVVREETGPPATLLRHGVRGGPGPAPVAAPTKKVGRQPVPQKAQAPRLVGLTVPHPAESSDPGEVRVVTPRALGRVTLPRPAPVGLLPTGTGLPQTSSDTGPSVLPGIRNGVPEDHVVVSRDVSYGSKVPCVLRVRVSEEVLKTDVAYGPTHTPPGTGGGRGPDTETSNKVPGSDGDRPFSRVGSWRTVPLVG